MSDGIIRHAVHRSVLQGVVLLCLLFAAPATVAAQSPGQVFRDCPDCPEMVVIAPGRFTMGSPVGEKGRSDNESPQHEVTIGYALAVGKFPVTFAEWGACLKDGGCNGYSPSDNDWGRGRQPVINVNWSDAKAYLIWLPAKTGHNYRLLSEAKYEYAARAGTTTARYWGEDIGDNNADCSACGSIYDGKQTAPVGSFAPNAFGLYDMLGNVWEWTEDCWTDDYKNAPTDGRVWSGGNCGLHVHRGGSWYYYPGDLRSALRSGDNTGNRIITLGFRVARTL